MKLGLIGRVWLGFQLGKFVKTVVEERQAFHQRRSRIHGYTRAQVNHILQMCCEAKPTLHAELMAMDEDRRNNILAGILTCLPSKFREQFGFDRPPPN